jgi:hypothetical protein
MNNFQLKKETFTKIKDLSDFLVITQKNHKSLGKITEVTEPQSTFYNQDLTQEEQFSDFPESKHVSPFLVNFLTSLQKFNHVYFFFYKKAFLRRFYEKRPKILYLL